MLEINVKKQLGKTFIEADISIPRSGVTVFFGHSGAGKTSLINMISGLLKPDEGRIVVNGRVLFDSEKKLNLPPEKRRCGYIFQDKRLFPYLTVKKNLLFGSKDTPSQRFDEIVNLLGIGDLLDRKPVFLSGGEAQRVAIGRALLSDPELMLMDEPMSSLDSDKKDELIPYIERLHSAGGIPVILVTHSYDEVVRLADHIVIMEAGKVTANGTLFEVFSKNTDDYCPSCSVLFPQEPF